tara:strand:- start:12102 stop:15602 length:3501 start_codon:yes stop_codon:yes gene_type:complete
MKRVELIVGDYPNQVSLDLNKDSISIALQYSIDDIRNIDKKNSNYSKTITLPGTDKNNITFGNLFDVNSSFDIFNPNKRVSALVLVDSTPVIEGFLQLRNVIKLNNADLQGNKIEYNVVVFDDTIDFMQTIGDKLIRGNADIADDLDFSDLDHTYNSTNIEDAWDNHIWSDVYQYPLMEKKTKGYETKDFKPAFYHKALLSKIADKAGYHLEGSFMNNDIYEKEIILWDGDTPEIPPAVAVQREFHVGVVETTPEIVGVYSHKNTVINTNPNFGHAMNFNDVSPPKHFDNTGLYQHSQNDPGLLDYSYWESPNTGSYKFTVEGNFTITYTKDHSFSPDPAVYQNYPMKLSKNNSKFAPSGPVYGGVRVSLIGGSGTVIGQKVLYMGEYEDFDDLWITGASYPGTLTPSKTIGPMDLKFEFNSSTIAVGEKVRIVFEIWNSTTNFGWSYFYGANRNRGHEMGAADIRLDFNRNGDAAFYNNTLVSEIIDDGGEIEVNNYLPKDVKQKDIISDIIKRYNVYIRKHPTKSKTLLLDSRDDFYDEGSTEITDWTQKKDYSSEDKIEFLTDLHNKEILFHYTEANDIEASSGKYNKEYLKGTGDIYGQKLITFDNDFVKGTKKIISPFSTVPLVYSGQTGGDDVIVPAVSVNEGLRKPVLCYWGGRLRTRLADGNFGSNLVVDYGGVIKSYNDYPYAGHWNNPIDPTIDIHYGEITYEFYPQINSITSNNLFNRYWRNYYNQISSGKLVTSKFYLREVDINLIKDNLNVRIFVKDSYYIINKVIDYKPLEDGLTTVELLRIEQGSSFTSTSNPTSTYPTAPPTYQVTTPSTGPFLSNISTPTQSPDVMVLGDDNEVGADVSSIILGDSNNVYDNSDNVLVIGDNNSVSSGLTNVNVFGSGITVSSSNTNVISGNNNLNGANYLTENTYIDGVNSISGFNTISGTTSVSGTASFNNDVVIDGDLVIDGITFTNLWLPGTGLDSVVQSNSAAPNTASSYYSITTGVSNTNDGGYSGILGGASNTINTTSTGTTILGGEANSTTAGNSGTLGGSFNTITGNGNASIVAGSNNTVSGKYSTIIGGSVNTNSGLHSSIVGGTNNNISGDRSVILGGTLITGTQDKTVYVPKLVITETYIPTGTSDTNGETGEISYDGSYVYIKTASGWLRSALSSF